MKNEFVIGIENGLHARPATFLVSVASKFECEITLTYNDVTVDLKSIMNVLSLALKKGALITINASGIDEVEAIKKISESIIKLNLR